MSWNKLPWDSEVATLSDNAPQDVDKSAASAGVASGASRDDHKHDVSTAAPAAITENASQVEGTATSLTRSDHEHASPADWTPKTHATSHKSGGGDAVALHEFGVPTGSVDFNDQQVINLLLEQVDSLPGSGTQGEIVYLTTDDHLYVWVA